MLGEREGKIKNDARFSSLDDRGDDHAVKGYKTRGQKVSVE